MARKPVKPMQLPKLRENKNKRIEGLKDHIKHKVSKVTKGEPEIARRIVKEVPNKEKSIKQDRIPLTECNSTIHEHVTNKIPLLSLERVKLPTFEEVFLIMQDHQNKLGMAFRNNKWGDIPAIEAETKKKLDAIGIGLYIDFTPDDKKKEWDNKVAKLAGK